MRIDIRRKYIEIAYNKHWRTIGAHASEGDGSRSVLGPTLMRVGGLPSLPTVLTTPSAQLDAMMVMVPHCHRQQPISIEQSEAILAGPRKATHLRT